MGDHLGTPGAVGWLAFCDEIAQMEERRSAELKVPGSDPAVENRRIAERE